LVETVLLLCGEESELILDLVETIGADAFTVEENDVVCIVAENAGRVVFLQNDAIVVGENLNGILYFDVHGFANLNGEHDSAQLVHFSDHSCRFHNVQIPFICYDDGNNFRRRKLEQFACISVFLL